VERDLKRREAAERDRKRRKTEEREARERCEAEEREAQRRQEAAEREERERSVAAEREERERREAAEELQNRERLRLEEIQSERDALWSSNKVLIQKFLEIAERKVSIIDDNGDENWEALPQEIETCLLKIARRNGISEREFRTVLKKERLSEEYRWLIGRARRALAMQAELDRASSRGIECCAWMPQLCQPSPRLRELPSADLHPFSRLG
jgi:hypothetical protein